MAILHKPGTVVSYVLPSDVGKAKGDQTIVKIKVPDEATVRKIYNLRVEAAEDLDVIEISRGRFGYYLEAIENLKFSDGTKFELQREDDGKLTRECVIELSGILDELSELLDKCTVLSGDERKNSK